VASPASAPKRRWPAIYTGRIGTILHPSPASPLANRGWAPAVEKQFENELGVAL